MSQCLNPSCNLQNLDRLLSFCQECGSKLKIGDRYRAERILGQGGFGRTFIGVDEALPSCPPCVIKQFFPADLSSAVKAAELFHQEAIRLDDLGKHPQIPTLFAHLEHEGRQYLIQEFVDGQDLFKELQQQGAFSEAKIRLLLSDLLPILQFIHERNVIHRDIKPENIIRRRSPSTSGSVAASSHVLVDFGAAKYVSASGQTGTGIGSAVYVAPEQLRGKAIFASDIYSLGVTCIHLLTNVSPFELMDMDGNWIWRNFLENHSINRTLGNILDRMILVAPSQRYQTAQAVLNDLKNLITTDYPASVTRLARPTYQVKQGVSSKARITPISTPKSQPVSVIAPALSQFSFEMATVSLNRVGIGKFSKNQLQINTKQKIGRSYFETLGNIQGKAISLEMVYIHAGKFSIGSPANEIDRSDNENPRQTINLPAFFMSRFPITQRQWKVVMDNNPAIFIGNADRPVESISWDDVQAFCRTLMEHTGRTYRLPSETEWEYACRAGTMTSFCFGEAIASNLANYNGTNAATTEVGSYPANGFGLHDMHGNVWEWCADNWHEDYDLLPKDGSAWTQGGDRSCRVVRGGSWRDPAHYCRSAKRYHNAANQGDRATGFRLAITLTLKNNW
jgi:formylglycine-generating enzyme required for sulfatase activity